MVASYKQGQPGVQRSGVLPPWLWFWLVLYMLGFPAVLDHVKPDVITLLTGTDRAHHITYGLSDSAFSVAEIWFDLALTVGVLTVFLPWIRTMYLRYKFGLTELQSLPLDTPPETVWTLSAISEFVNKQAPGLCLTYNTTSGHTTRSFPWALICKLWPGGKLLREQAFVYPIGYRRAGLALSGSFLTQWDKNRPAAEAVLLHEIGHYRHGDMYIVGAGSLLEAVVRHWLSLTVLLTVITSLIDRIMYIWEDMSIAATVSLPDSLPSVILDNLKQMFVLDVPFMLITFSAAFFYAASLFTFVIAAIWSAEINADRFVVDTAQSPQALALAMEQHGSSPWLHWLRTGMYHPPRALRQWLVLHSEGTRGLMLLLLMFPASWFLRLLFALAWACAEYSMLLYSGTSMGYIAGELGIDIENFLKVSVPTWSAMAVLMTLWPLLSRYWERLFCRTMSQPSKASYRAYLSSAVCIVLICTVGFVLSLLPTPPEPADFRPNVPYTLCKPSGHCRVGHPVKIGSVWIVTLDKVQERPTAGFLAAKAGHTFLAIDVSLQNISSRTSTLFTGLQFILQDSHGASYKEAFTVATPHGDIPAGATVAGQLNYQVPVSASQFTLSFTADREYTMISKPTVWDITTNAPVTVPAMLVNGSTPVYAGLQQTYRGTVTNTMHYSWLDGSGDVSAKATLYSITQDQQGNITGNMAVQPPLVGSGPFQGTVRKDGSIQFTVIPDDNSGESATQFRGTIHLDGSMSGTCTTSHAYGDKVECSSWQFNPA